MLASSSTIPVETLSTAPDSSLNNVSPPLGAGIDRFVVARESRDSEASIHINASSIMLVDDSVVLRDRLMEAFQERGFRVTVASSCEEAIRVFTESPTELAVVDLRMPGKTGLTLIPELKAIDARVKIVMLSGFGSMATAIDAIRLGATNFIPKPADVDDILLAFVRGDSEVEVQEEASELHAPTLAQAEWEHIHRVLADCNNNISEAARRLGIHRRSLQRKLRKRAP